MSGITVEVINTDAEGRLVLSDAMTYARELGVNRMVDIATLTGAIVVSLGKICTGVMGNDQEFIDQVLKAGEDTGERIWQLPMFDEYKDTLKSNVADMMNVGSDRGAGSITAAKFLSEFADGVPWAHLTSLERPAALPTRAIWSKAQRASPCEPSSTSPWQASPKPPSPSFPSPSRGECHSERSGAK